MHLDDWQTAGTTTKRKRCDMNESCFTPVVMSSRLKECESVNAPWGPDTGGCGWDEERAEDLNEVMSGRGQDTGYGDGR